MSATYLATAIVTDKQPWGEKDAKVVLYSDEYGRLDLTVRGAKRLDSKLNAHLEVFNTVELMVIRGRQGDLVGSALSRRTRQSLKADLSRLISAGDFFSSSKKYLLAGEADLSVYNLLEDFLNRLDDAPAFTDKDLKFLSLAAEIKLLNILGFASDPTACQLCSKRFSDGAWQRLSGEFICDECVKLVKDETIFIDATLIACLAFVFAQPLSAWPVKAPEVDQNMLKNVKQRLEYYR